MISIYEIDGLYNKQAHYICSMENHENIKLHYSRLALDKLEELAEQIETLNPEVWPILHQELLNRGATEAADRVALKLQKPVENRVEVTYAEGEDSTHLYGVKGWLLFGVIALVLNLVLNVVNLMQLLGKSNSYDSQAMMTVVNYDRITIFISIIFVGYLLGLVNNRRKKFIPLVKIFFLYNALRSIIEWVMISSSGLSLPMDQKGRIIMIVIASLVWAAYYSESVRVKNTFTE